MIEEDKELKKKVREELRPKDTKDDIERAERILRENGFVMSIWGCGCCSSPAIYMEYKGELILDTEGLCLDSRDSCENNQ